MAELGNLEVGIRGNVTDLQANLKKGSASVNEFANKTQAATAKVNTAFKSVGGTSIFNLTEKLRSLQNAVFTEKDRAKIKLYNAEIAITEKQLKSLQTAGTSSMGALGNGAGKAFGALKTIANILPGLGIAGLLAFAIGPITNYIGSLFDVSEAVKSAKKNLEEFNKETGKEYGKDSAQLKILKQAIEDTSLPMATRLQAIKDLKKEYPTYFAALTNEQLLTGNVANAYNKAAEAILRKARANAASKRIEANEDEKILIQLENQNDALETNNKLKNAKPRTFTTTSKETGETKSITTNLDYEKRVIKGQYELRKKAAQDRINQKDAENNFYLKIVKDGSEEIIKVETETADKIKTVREKASEGFRKISFKPTEVEFIDPDDFAREIEAAFNKIQGQTQVFYRPKVSIEPFVSTINYNDLDRARKTIELKMMGIVKAINGAGELINIGGLLENEFDALYTSTEGKLKAFNDLIKATLIESLEGIGESLGQSLAGAGKFINLMASSIFKTMGGFLVQMGKAAVETSALFTALKKATVVPTLGLIGGLAAIAFGTLLKNVKIPAFAQGVNNFRGGLALVGEKGPEMVRLPTGSDVIPNNKLADLAGGGKQEHIIYGSISGDSIFLSNQRAAQRRGRQG